MYCSKCGNELKNNSNFCSKCGNRINCITNGNKIKDNSAFASLIDSLKAIVIGKNSNNNNSVSKMNNQIKKKGNSPKTNIKKLKYFKDDMIKWLEEDSIKFKNEYDYYNNNCCPNCGCVLDNKILSSKTCSGCKQKILLRTNKINSQKLLIGMNRKDEYDKHDKKRSEILYFEKIMSGREYVYNNYMNKFYELKSSGQDPRNVVYPFVNYVGSQLDNVAYKAYMKIINTKDMALESFEVIRKFNLANTQYFLLADIAYYKGHLDIALDTYATAAYRGVQISILESILNPYHEMKTIDIMGNVFSGTILRFLNESGYSLDDFKKSFLENRHPFILEQLSNEESWNYVYDTIKLYKEMESKNRN